MTNAERDNLAAALLAWRDILMHRYWRKFDYAAFRDLTRRHDNAVYAL